MIVEQEAEKYGRLILKHFQVFFSIPAVHLRLSYYLPRVLSLHDQCFLRLCVFRKTHFCKSEN